MDRKCYVIILAAGKGNRMYYKIPKQFIRIRGKTILEHTIQNFEICDMVNDVIVVCHPDFLSETRKILRLSNKVTKIIPGGQTRRESAYKGLCEINDHDSYILIHDAVRPFVTQPLIKKCCLALDKYDAVYPSVPSEDTMIFIDSSMKVSNIPLRSYLMRGQTPQAFKYPIIKKAHELARNDKNVDTVVTNDCGLVFRYNLADIYTIVGDRYNFKITHEEDLFFAENLISRKDLNKKGKCD